MSTLVCRECQNPAKHCDCPESVKRSTPLVANSIRVGVCIEDDCTNPVYRTNPVGAPPKRCAPCRGRVGSKGNAHDGQIIQIRKIFQSLPKDKRRSGPEAGVDMYIRCAAEALTGATGIALPVSESIIEAVDALLRLGESGVDIRRRLNHSGFGNWAAGSEAASTGSVLDEYLIEGNPW